MDTTKLESIPVPSADEDEKSPSNETVEAGDTETVALKVRTPSPPPEEVKTDEPPRSKSSPFSSKDWSYDEGYTLEPVVKTNPAGVERKLYFRKKDADGPRKVYFAMKVLRFSDISNVKESFRARFHLYLNWIMTEAEYDNYEAAKLKPKTRSCWEPKFKPRVELVNAVTVNQERHMEYPPDGHYRCTYFPNWVEESVCGFDSACTPFLRQKIEYDVTFSEQMELRTFPVDCQDFSIVICEESGVKKCVLMPEPRYVEPNDDGGGVLDAYRPRSNFFKLDPTFSVLDEWDFYSSMVEVGGSSSSASRSKKSNSQVIIRFKMSRNWTVYVNNYIIYFMLITVLSLSCFTLDAEDIGERMNLAVVILLTLVSFQHTVFAKLPKIPYLTLMYKYIFCSFLFVVVVLLESSFLDTINDAIKVKRLDSDIINSADTAMGQIMFLVWVLYHLWFTLRAMWMRHKQARKLLMNSDEVKLYVDEKYPQFLMSWKYFMEIDAKGSVDEWQHHRDATAEAEFAALEQAMLSRKNSLRKEEESKKKSAVGSMEFGASGNIMSFTSYAVKERRSEIGFCSYIMRKCKLCCASCLIGVCCCACRDKETDDVKTSRMQSRKQSM